MECSIQHFSVLYAFGFWNENVLRVNGGCFKVSKDAKIRNRFNQVPYLTQDTNGKVTNSQ